MSGFHHEAVLYASDKEYLAGLLPDLRAAIDADGAVLVAVDEDKVALLRGALGADADRVRFTNMERLGRNPACIIPAWREFIATSDSGPRLGIGEPVWPGRSDAELIECRRHESLLNLAFDGGGPWRLLCPYDVRALPADVLADARHNHPHVGRRGVSKPCADYVEPPTMLSWDGALPEPAAEPVEMPFTREDLTLVRMFVGERAVRAGFDDDRVSDLVLAVNELATNSMRHGGGSGVAERVAGERHAPLRGHRQRPHRRPAGRPRASARCARRRARAVARQSPVRPRAGAHVAGRERDPPAHEPRRRFLVPASAPLWVARGVPTLMSGPQ